MLYLALQERDFVRSQVEEPKDAIVDFGFGVGER
jgi:hypothetical protein